MNPADEINVNDKLFSCGSHAAFHGNGLGDDRRRFYFPLPGGQGRRFLCPFELDLVWLSAYNCILILVAEGTGNLWNICRGHRQRKNGVFKPGNRKIRQGKEQKMNPYKIVIIEDEELIREELETLLINAGYTVECIIDFAKTLDYIQSASPDLILLDVNLPGQDGYRLCSSIRTFSSIPILFLTGRSTTMDELQALTLGGDDFITKPYNIPILLARINLLLRKRTAGQTEVMEYKRIRLNLIAGTLTIDKKEIELTKTELKIMYYLFKHTGEIVSRIDLVDYLWDNEIHIDDNTLSVNIMRIREKLRALGVTDFIQTKRGMGYKI